MEIADALKAFIQCENHLYKKAKKFCSNKDCKKFICNPCALENHSKHLESLQSINKFYKRDSDILDNFDKDFDVEFKALATKNYASLSFKCLVNVFHEARFFCLNCLNFICLKCSSTHETSHKVMKVTELFKTLVEKVKLLKIIINKETFFIRNMNEESNLMTTYDRSEFFLEEKLVKNILTLKADFLSFINNIKNVKFYLFGKLNKIFSQKNNFFFNKKPEINKLSLLLETFKFEKEKNKFYANFFQHEDIINSLISNDELIEINEILTLNSETKCVQEEILNHFNNILEMALKDFNSYCENYYVLIKKSRFEFNEKIKILIQKNMNNLNTQSEFSEILINENLINSDIAELVNGEFQIHKFDCYDSKNYTNNTINYAAKNESSLNIGNPSENLIIQKQTLSIINDKPNNCFEKLLDEYIKNLECSGNIIQIAFLGDEAKHKRHAQQQISKYNHEELLNSNDSTIKIPEKIQLQESKDFEILKEVIVKEVEVLKYVEKTNFDSNKLSIDLGTEICIQGVFKKDSNKNEDKTQNNMNDSDNNHDINRERETSFINISINTLIENSGENALERENKDEELKEVEVTKIDEKRRMTSESREKNKKSVDRNDISNKLTDSDNISQVLESQNENENNINPEQEQKSAIPTNNNEINEDIIHINNDPKLFNSEENGLLEKLSESCRSVTDNKVNKKSSFYDILSFSFNCRSCFAFNPKEKKLIEIESTNLKFPFFHSFINIPPYSYIGGGKDEKGRELNFFHRFTRVEEKRIEFDQLKEMNVGRYNHIFVYYPEKNQILCIGGNKIKSCESYDINMNIWSKLPDLVTSREGPSACITNKHMLYVFFGLDKIVNKYVNTVEMINLENPQKFEVLNVKGNQNIFKKHSTSCLLLSSEKVLIFGGINSLRNPCKDILLYDIKTNSAQIYSVALPINSSFHHCSFIDLKMSDDNSSDINLDNNNRNILYNFTDDFKVIGFNLQNSTFEI